MSARKVVILDGAEPGDESLETVVSILTDVVQESGAEVQTFTLRETKLGHCIGCFGCWLETPGICIEGDAGREIARAMIRSETTILVTPVTFGGYSSQLKKINDRWIPLLLPYFRNYFGELHHTPRYSSYPRLVGIGVQHRPNSEEASIFKVLVGRNAINFHAPSHAAEVVLSTDGPGTLRQRFEVLLSREDPLPLGEALTSLMPLTDSAIASAEPRGRSRALLIVGSPKTKSPSTSGVLGGYLLGRLEERGWETESVTLKASLRREKGQTDLLSAVDRADLLVLAFPLYIDALPFLVTKALEVIAAHRREVPRDPPQRLVVVCNNGFPEAHQNVPALAICRQFAVQSGMAWAGSLAMGAGEALISGQPLTANAQPGRPPVKHVMRALDLAGQSLATGEPVPGEAVSMIAKNPIPLAPFAVWRWIFSSGGHRGWQHRAAGNGVSKERMLDRPYAT